MAGNMKCQCGYISENGRKPLRVTVRNESIGELCVLTMAKKSGAQRYLRLLE